MPARSLARPDGTGLGLVFENRRGDAPVLVWKKIRKPKISEQDQEVIIDVPGQFSDRVATRNYILDTLPSFLTATRRVGESLISVKSLRIITESDDKSLSAEQIASTTSLIQEIKSLAHRHNPGLQISVESPT